MTRWMDACGRVGGAEVVLEGSPCGVVGGCGGGGGDWGETGGVDACVAFIWGGG